MSKSSTQGPQRPSSVFYKAALAYARQFQLSVFPCLERGKRPLTSHGCKDASRNPNQVAKWWLESPNANIGIACGQSSGGLLVLDVDGDQGRESLLAVIKTLGTLPATPEVLTGNGHHYYFRASALLKNCVGLVPGIDVRAENGYVIAPPSIHESGRVYTWEVSSRIDEIAITEAPGWLINVLQKRNEAEVRNWGQFFDSKVKIGSRNASLASIAGHLFRKYVDPHVAYVLLDLFNKHLTEAPLPHPEFVRTIDSIARAEAARRGRSGYNG